ncbi:hypothetical protein JA1_000549 [Spathaspora sp. JA1]|nr:hypothetical protein JA1_000549 [Spathaspora sp. JA1]
MSMVLATPIPANIQLKATETGSGTQSTRTFSLILPTYTPTAPIITKKNSFNPNAISFNNKQEILDSQNVVRETKWSHSHYARRDSVGIDYI